MAITKEELVQKIEEKFNNCGFPFTITGTDDKESRYLHVRFTLNEKFVLEAQADTDWDSIEDIRRILYGHDIRNNTPFNDTWMMCSIDLWNDEELLDFLANWESKYKKPFDEMVAHYDALEYGKQAIDDAQERVRSEYRKTIKKLKNESNDESDDEDED